MGRRIDPSWWSYGAIFCSSQTSITCMTIAMICTTLSVGWCILKEPLLLTGNSNPHMAAAGFLTGYLSSPLLYDRK